MDEFDANRLLDWLASAAPGESIIYHTGDLAYAVHFEEVKRSRLVAEGVKAADLPLLELALLRSTAQQLYEHGRIFLTQRRRGDLPEHPTRGGAQFSYIATRRSPKPPTFLDQVSKELQRRHARL